jgi:D-alanyl-D-alanine carboxypeptidase
MIRVSESASKCIGTTARLKPFYWIMLKDLFYGIMLPSGNDAAHLLAEVMGYLISITKEGEWASFDKVKEIDLTKKNTSLYLA